ncbi:uncharacterized protein LOC111365722 [Olea europaea var. sylvestris]|uniref:uncharacterized protein LOC111365722 n=1 Tax=Olea europaea var. sylvestris TaxID=158386 RepID=UPI000C1D47C6|nr:uncharacterized protein LOC111365722 [Olea europaea var. sylvestris]
MSPLNYIHFSASACFMYKQRECSRGKDYRLIKLTVTVYNSKSERRVVVECRGHDAAKICKIHHAHGQAILCLHIIVMVLNRTSFIFHHHPCENDWVSVFFECETLKAKNTAEEHIQKFMPKLAGWMQLKSALAVKIGPMSITRVDFGRTRAQSAEYVILMVLNSVVN